MEDRNMKVRVPRSFLPLSVPFSSTVLHMPEVTKHLKDIGAWYTKNSFGDHFPTYHPIEGSSKRLNEGTNDEFDEETEHNLINLVED